MAAAIDAEGASWQLTPPGLPSTGLNMILTFLPSHRSGGDISCSSQ
eukprot:CAMPEP_0197666984 /NCGR_PEP_ID=MMETSP1338-20131121/64712_1 /TAXON_ID=43686 ORGANISM="Pelagodinium beii, Strain RCC1491" /NCGR_SAMPLE_ID=MMETSP1338 /ASSEMBLY_ACC=CAM_ASM_000754 /LENGTH=45 /DNA_ID= /DNA_START= /DNA_END= /DNA_ORIENTATION=